jgi:hypothetical protein
MGKRLQVGWQGYVSTKGAAWASNSPWERPSFSRNEPNIRNALGGWNRTYNAWGWLSPQAHSQAPPAITARTTDGAKDKQESSEMKNLNQSENVQPKSIRARIRQEADSTLTRIHLDCDLKLIQIKLDADDTLTRINSRVDLDIARINKNVDSALARMHSHADGALLKLTRGDEQAAA